MLFGIIDMGRLLQQEIQLTEAAREGARIGALNGAVSDVQAQVTSVLGSGSGVTYPSTPTVCTNSSTVGSDSTVILNRTYVPVTPLLTILPMFGASGSTSWTLKATGVMSCIG